MILFPFCSEFLTESLSSTYLLNETSALQSAERRY